METLQNLINKFFPNDTDVKYSKVTLKTTGTSSLNNIPLSYGKHFFLKPIAMAETNKRYVFDVRDSLLFQSKLSSLVGPFWLGIPSFLLLYFLLNTPLNYSLVISLTMAICSLVTSIWNIRINQGLVNIFVINKDSVTKQQTEGVNLIIEGTFTNPNSFSLANYVPTNLLTANDKIFSGKIIVGKALSSGPVSLNYSYSIKTVSKS